jgi:hypothetical protein
MGGVEEGEGALGEDNEEDEEDGDEDAYRGGDGEGLPSSLVMARRENEVGGERSKREYSSE